MLSPYLVRFPHQQESRADLTPFPLFLADSPGKNLFDQLHFREDDRGANTWLVVPNDKGVFHGSSDQDGIVCVHPVQVYLDLKGHPERAKEAASMVRQEKLKWRWDA
ncbi:MAG: hypothetical protein DRH90_10000 [Deltaproteobacteria bacterium]|nr:MAG: hypothetical protein DRH90_10000 [Deltaproteobacteria bacterium]RLC15357.1 MAG: hypothetical protein DRI24_11170 [Deltaproteobacteria bacterium]